MKVIHETIAQAPVVQPNLVTVTERGGAHIFILQLRVAKAEVGNIIGRHGRIAGALRTLSGVVSAETKKRMLL